MPELPDLPRKPEGPEEFNFLRGSWKSGLLPDPDLTVSAWADAHRKLTSRGSNEAGPWRTSRTPYLRAIMDALSPSSPIRRVVLMKGSQVGATETGTNWVGFVIHHAPGPMMIVWPTLEMSQRNSKQRIDPMIQETPALYSRVATRRAQSRSNTILVKEFEGGILVMTGSNSPVGLRSMPVRYLFLDEMDVYPAFTGKGMDPVEEAIKRTSTFEHRSKIFMASTPTVSKLSRIEEQWLASDQRRFFVPCPRCGHLQTLEWERVRWEKGDFASVHYVCEACEGRFFEHEKTWFLERGEWRPTALASDPLTQGYHISSLYSPYGWMSWQTCAKEWEAAQGNPEKLRTFVTGVLGLPWREREETPDWRRLYERREDWQIGTVPEGVLVLTAGADVQRDRIEVSIWGWAENLESWLIDHAVLRGDPQQPEVWAQLTALTLRFFPSSGHTGQVFPITRLAIDSGDQTLAVYAWQRSVPSLPIMCVKGMDRWDREAPVTGPRRIDVGRDGKKRLRGVELYTVSVSTFKSQFYAQLALPRPTDEELASGTKFPPGSVHLPRGCSSDLIQQLVSEHLVGVKMKSGRIRQEWRKVQNRNEALDCRVYARAALHDADVYGEGFWRQFKASHAPEKEREERKPQGDPAVRGGAPQRKPWIEPEWRRSLR